MAAGLPTVEASDSTKEPKVAKTADSEEPKVVAEPAESPKETEIKSEVEKEPPVKVSV